ncbi:MAG TPA: hypothetical protein VG294_14040 [Solirubrobacteraceae bacterium]|nr:hypothetical protein [Solirubrobacteraceae bacterium]
MPEWLLPWVVPMGLVVAVILVAISPVVAGIALVLLVVVRARHLKNHPPELELVHKPFWKF